MTKRWEFIYLGKGNEDLSSRGRESGPSAVGNALHKTPGEKKKLHIHWITFDTSFRYIDS